MGLVWATVRPRLSLHQVDPGMVPSETKHVPGTPHEHDAPSQDHPEADKHHHDLEHICPDHGFHTTLCARGDNHRPAQGCWGMAGAPPAHPAWFPVAQRTKAPFLSFLPVCETVCLPAAGGSIGQGEGERMPWPQTTQQTVQHLVVSLSLLFVSGPCSPGWPRTHKLPASASPKLL